MKQIGRAVVLTHDRSRVGRVEMVSELDVDMLFSRRSPLQKRDWVERVVGHIGRDHEFHRQSSERPGRRRR